jgi:hypothetical protein
VQIIHCLFDGAVIFYVKRFGYLKKSINFTPNQTKNYTMKKLFSILAIAAVMTACNNSTDEAKTKTDTTATSNPAMEAAKTADTATKMIDAAKDTMNKKMEAAKDTASKMIDKAGDKMKEAADKMKEKAKEPAKH